MQSKLVEHTDGTAGHCFPMVGAHSSQQMKHLDVSINIIICKERSITIYMLPSIGLSRSIEKIINEGTADKVSIYGFGTINEKPDIVGILCTLSVSISGNNILITDGCILSVNGGPVKSAGTKYTMFYGGITAAVFPPNNNVH